MHDDEQGWLSRIFIPDYDQLSLFLMSITFILLLFTNTQMRVDFSRFLFVKKDIRACCTMIFKSNR